MIIPFALIGDDKWYWCESEETLVALADSHRIVGHAGGTSPINCTTHVNWVGVAWYRIMTMDVQFTDWVDVYVTDLGSYMTHLRASGVDREPTAYYNLLCTLERIPE